MKNISFLTVLFLFLVENYLSAQQLEAYVSNSDLSQRLVKNTVFFTENPIPSDLVYELNPALEYQSIEGFGAALTGSSAIVLNYLNEDARYSLLKTIFDPEEGAAFNYLRVSIGASDFSSCNWTHTREDNCTFEFKDPEGIVPILRTVKSINPHLKIMASPWSPPACVKTETSGEHPLIGGEFNKAKGKELSNYLIHFINAMKDRSLNVDAITIQNEPLYNAAKYMCMYMPAPHQRDFIKNYFGPQLFRNNKVNNLHTKLYVYDHNWDYAFDYVSVLQKDKKAWKYVAGTAFHGYGGEVKAQSLVKALDTSKDILLTEITGHTTADGSPDDFRWAINNIVIGNLQNYGSGFIYWNLALDTFGPVVDGGPVNCRGIININQTTKDIRYNVEYYAIEHASKFIQPGAKRVDCGAFNQENVKQVAFINPDQSRVMLLYNDNDSDKRIVIKDGARYAEYVAGAKNVISFIWNKQL